MPPRARPDLGSHKRARVDISAVGGAAHSDTELASPIDPRFFDSKTMAACKRDFHAAQPFPHLRLTKFCDEGRMRGIREEITGRLHAKFKETDLYKVCAALPPPRAMYLLLKLCAQVNQTGDLTVIDDLPAAQRQQLQQLCSLRDSLYTKQFRQWIQHVTGCCELTDRVDCAANIYEAGCHLLCHDDVISTRHVSYIIYLSDGDWAQEDGGALELYPVAPGGNAPAARPSAQLLPSWNSMCVQLPHTLTSPPSPFTPCPPPPLPAPCS